MRSVLSLILLTALTSGCSDAEAPPSDDGPLLGESGAMSVGGDAIVVGALSAIKVNGCWNEHGYCGGLIDGIRFTSGRSSAPDVVRVSNEGVTMFPGIGIEALSEGEATLTLEYLYPTSDRRMLPATTTALVRVLPIQTISPVQLFCEHPIPPDNKRTFAEPLPLETREIALFETDTLSMILRGGHPDVETLTVYGAPVDQLLNLEGDLQVRGLGNTLEPDEFIVMIDPGGASGTLRSASGDWSLAVRKVTPGDVDGLTAIRAPSGEPYTSGPWLRLSVAGADVCTPIHLNHPDVAFLSQTPEVCQWSSERGLRFFQKGWCEGSVTYLPGNDGQGVQTPLRFRAN